MYTYNSSNEYAITFGDTIIIQCINFLYLLILAWYLAEILPPEYGTSRPAYFIFQPKRWGFLYSTLQKSLKQIIKVWMYFKNRFIGENLNVRTSLDYSIGIYFNGISTETAAPRNNNSASVFSCNEEEEILNSNIEPVPQELLSQMNFCGRSIEIHHLA